MRHPGTPLFEVSKPMTKAETNSSDMPVVRRRKAAADGTATPILLTVPDLREPIPAAMPVSATPDDGVSCESKPEGECSTAPTSELIASSVSTAMDKTLGEATARMDQPRSEFGIAPPRAQAGHKETNTEAEGSGAFGGPEAGKLDARSMFSGWFADGVSDEWKKNLGTIGTIAAAVLACTLVARALKQDSTRDQTMVLENGAEPLTDEGITVVRAVPMTQPLPAVESPPVSVQVPDAAAVERTVNSVQPNPGFVQPADIHAATRAAADRVVAPINPMNTTMTSEPPVRAPNPFSEAAGSLGAGAADMMARVKAQTAGGLDQIQSQFDRSATTVREMGSQVQRQVAGAMQGMGNVNPASATPRADDFGQWLKQGRPSAPVSAQSQNLAGSNQNQPRGITEADIWPHLANKHPLPPQATLPSEGRGVPAELAQQNNMPTPTGGREGVPGGGVPGVSAAGNSTANGVGQIAGPPATTPAVAYPGTPANKFPPLDQYQRLLEQRRLERTRVAQVPEQQVPVQATSSPDNPSNPGAGVLR